MRHISERRAATGRTPRYLCTTPRSRPAPRLSGCGDPSGAPRRVIAGPLTDDGAVAAATARTGRGRISCYQPQRLTDQSGVRQTAVRLLGGT